MSSKSSGQKSGQLVLPGERLGVIEEFIPNTGTYVKNGVIYSKVIGRTLLDHLSKRVSVYQLIEVVKVPKIDSIVVGQVSSAQTQNAVVHIFRIDDKIISGFFTGILHISDVQLRYVESMLKVCKPGDILRAKVVSEMNKIYHLSTKDTNLGVIYAFCSQCGHVLEPSRQRMQCPRCGKIEKRRITPDYGQEVMW